MNELTTKLIEPTIPMVFETVTEHRGRTLYEQQSRHKQATGHNKPGKLQVREEEMKIVGAGIRQRRIIVFQECLDCKADNAKRPGQTLEELQDMTKVELIVQAKYIGARGHKQMTKPDLIESIIDKYESSTTIPNP